MNAPPIDRPVADERRRALAISAIEGASSQAHSSLTGLNVGGNAITTGFAVLLGAGDVALGLLAAIPQLSACAQLAAAWALPRIRSRRRAVAFASGVARLSWPVLGLLPLLLGRSAALAAFLVLWAVTNGLISFCGNLWVSWMADLVPPGERATYFSRRSIAFNVSGLLFLFAAGYALDTWFGGVPRQGAAWDPSIDVLRAHGFAALFAGSAVFGILCTALLLHQWEPPRTGEKPAAETLLSAIAGPFVEAARTPGFRGLLVFVALFGLANGIAAPFWAPYQMEQLRLDYSTLNGKLAGIAGVSGIAGLFLWGPLAARAGSRAVVAISVAIIATHPLYYLIATPERTWPVLLDAASSGLAWNGYNYAVFNVTLALAEASGSRRERLYAAYATTMGLTWAAASVLAGFVMNAVVQSSYAHAFGSLHPRQVVFLATSAARVVCLGLFLLLVRVRKC